ncbi:putative metal-dependent HD superfamily phosphohydrolase [Sphingomonas zeicaulis]|uniref:HD domain-containing protein n=1 Tax=Sphingomonas zeicaulis TaxID=1632740 RepID=UPI003D212AF7
MTIPEVLAAVPAGLLATLRRRHAEPQRAYHDWTHIEEMLALFAETRGDFAAPEAVLYAILFHDAVYDPQTHDNEERSAALLETLAGGVLDRPTRDRAVRMILATRRHRIDPALPAEEQADTARFLDMDLAILGADAARFDAYEQAIRFEYGHVEDDAFAAGRAAVLAGFGRRERLYLSDWGHHRFEASARANIARSLARLAPVA